MKTKALRRATVASLAAEIGVLQEAVAAQVAARAAPDLPEIPPISPVQQTALGAVAEAREQARLLLLEKWQGLKRLPRTFFR